jgi:hypothetical protein
MKESKLCGFCILIDKKGNLITEESTVNETDINNLSMKENEKDLIKSVLRTFNRKSAELHAEIESELRAILTLH